MNKELKTKFIKTWMIAEQLGLVTGDSNALNFNHNICFRADLDVFTNNVPVAYNMLPQEYDFTEKDIANIIFSMEQTTDAAIIESDLDYKIMLQNMERGPNNDFTKVKEFYDNPFARKLFIPIGSADIKVNGLVIKYLINKCAGMGCHKYSNFTYQNIFNLQNMFFPWDYDQAIVLLKTIIGEQLWDSLLVLFEKPYSDALFTQSVNRGGALPHNLSSWKKPSSFVTR